MQTLTERRVAAVGLARGRPASRAELGVAVGQVSVTCVRAIATSLLSRLSLIGESAKEAQGRRQYQGLVEQRMQQELQAHWLGRIQHPGVKHRGNFFLN